MAMQLVICIEGNRGYLMTIIFDLGDTCIVPNETFYTTANAAQMRVKHFLCRME